MYTITIKSKREMGLLLNALMDSMRYNQNRRDHYKHHKNEKMACLLNDEIVLLRDLNKQFQELLSLHERYER